MKKLRVVQFGTKHDHAADATLTLKELKGGFDLLGVIEENLQFLLKAKENPDYSGVPFISFEEALKLKPDAFLIETEEKLLVPTAKKVLEAGFNVYMDKPGSEDKESFREICELAKAKNLVLFLAYMYRYNPAVMYAKKMVEEGKLGDIISVEAQMNCSYSDPEKRKWLGEFKGGMMFFLGCHLIDLVVSIQGFPNEVIPLNCATGLEGVNSLDYGFCAYKYDRGISFVKTNATECNGFNRRQLVITGSKGTIEIKPLEVTVGEGRLVKKSYARQTIGIDGKWEDNSVPLDFEPEGRYVKMLLEFKKCVTGEIQNPYTYEYEAKLHDLIVDSCK